MPYIYKKATVNINGVSSNTRIKMLEEFMHKQDIDIVLLQAVTSPNINTINRYTAHISQGNEGRGTTILTKDGLPVHHLPSGRGIATEFDRVWVIKVYAPSDAKKNRTRSLLQH
jgi:exonuclease III